MQNMFMMQTLINYLKLHNLDLTKFSIPKFYPCMSCLEDISLVHKLSQ